MYCGSRFKSGAESRYHPIAGEAAAAAAVHGLDKTSIFNIHPNLLLALDLKPLINIFRDTALESITNPRLFNFKQKTMKYRFSTVWISFPNTASYSVPSNLRTRQKLLCLT